MNGAPVPVEFEGIRYSSRVALARYLSHLTGRTVKACTFALRANGDDGNRVIERYRRTDTKQLFHNGVGYPHRHALARYLAHLTGRTVPACASALHKYRDDAERVLECYRRADGASQVVVNNRTYKNKAAFFRHLTHYYGVKAPERSHRRPSNLTLEQIEARAKQLRAKRNPRFLSGDVTIFGWRFNSASAAFAYYRVPCARKVQRWYEHLDQGKPGYEFFLPALARLWEAGLLDERNRLPPETEAQMPRKRRPLNGELEAVPDEAERSYVDALMPPEQPTLRRLAMKKLDDWRQRAGVPLGPVGQ
jgi:hypothetical protein